MVPAKTHKESEYTWHTWTETTARFRLYIVPNDFYCNYTAKLLQDIKAINDLYYFLKWWHRFTTIKKYPVIPEQKIRQSKTSVPILIRKQCDSRSGVKGRTIRKRQGTFYKTKARRTVNETE